MGWRGTLRSIQAASRAAERDARRRQRELERQHREFARMQELERATHEVAAYENLIDRLQSMHKDGIQPVDWRELVELPPPEKPSRTNDNEKRAQSEFARFRPNLVDKLLGRARRKRATLEENIPVARNHDEAYYQQALNLHRKELESWERQHELATRVVGGDLVAYRDVLQDLKPFKEIGELGSECEFETSDPNAMEVTIRVRGNRVIPKESKNLLKSGKLSVKKVPVSRFHGLYQDYVCSCVMRVARDLLAILPVEMVVVTALDTLLNTASGHLEEQPILSVAIPRRTFETLNLNRIDPSDSMQNFVHRMKFKATKGFTKVERILASELRFSNN